MGGGRSVIPVQELFAQLQASGVGLTLSSQGKLLVSPPGRLPAELREALRHHKADVLALLSQPTPWPCTHCGQPAAIEAIAPRESDGVLLTYWCCEPCQV